MKKNLFLLLVFILSFFSFDLKSQEGNEQDVRSLNPPNPLELSTQWPSYLNVPIDKLSERIEAWQKSLVLAEKESKFQNPEEIEQEIQKILFLLQNFYQVKALSPILPFPSKSFASEYTINEMLEVVHSVRIKENKNRINKQTLKEKQRFIETLKKQRDAFTTEYNATKIKNEQKFLLGLSIIVKQLSIMIVNEEIARLEKNIQFTNQAIENQKREIDYALSHLNTTKEVQKSLIEEKKEAIKNLEEEKEILKDLDLQKFFFLGSGKEVLPAESELNQQKTLQAIVREALAEAKATLKAIETSFFLIKDEKNSYDSTKIDKEVESWKEKIRLFEQRVKDWHNAAQRGQQHAGQVLSSLRENQENTKELIQIEDEIVALSQATILLLQRIESFLQDSKFILNQMDKELIFKSGDGKKWLSDLATVISNTGKNILNSINISLIDIGATTITPLRIFYGLITLFIAYWIAHLVMKTINRLAVGHRAIQRSLIYRISRLIKYFIIILGVLFALMSLGFDFSTFLLIAGALGVGIGFGLQEIFRNFISGIIILFESNLKVGDFVELPEGERGVIRQINARNTVLNTNDGIDILVPNSKMLNEQVINWTLKDPYRRLHVPFSIAYGTDKDLVARLVVEAAKKVSSTLQTGSRPGPVVYITKLGDNGIEMKLVVWVNERVATRDSFSTSDYLWMIEAVLRENNIEIPFPQRDVRFRDGKENKIS